ncbi:MAG: ATP-binding protein, partial [Planctomycetota bacterium]|nr:ATP-binding protein [Planctomycetota bacterium]
MTTVQFQPATKAQAKLRAALTGPSGSGKTMSALRIATGIGGRIAVIDTERGSASKYADRFQFHTCQLADRTIDGYIAALAAAAKAGYDVLVIDSLSHGWQELLQEVDRLAKARFGGNTWAAWSEGTPKQRRLIDALTDWPGHVIATMRSKTEWNQQTDEKTGRLRPVRIGLAPEQGKGIEYEFDLLVELSADHVATVIKDRTGKFQDRVIEKPDEAFGRA